MSLGEAALCIPGMSLLGHPGYFWGLLVPFRDEPGAPALCTPAGGRLLGGILLGTHGTCWGREDLCLAREDGTARMVWQGWHSKDGTSRMAEQEDGVTRMAQQERRGGRMA